MAIPTPFNLPLNAVSIPSWAATVNTAIQAVINAPWDMGQRTKTVVIAASQVSLGTFPAQTISLLEAALGEYQAAGWRIGIYLQTTTQIKIVFDRW